MYWRQKKKESRERLSSQKKRRVKEREKEYKTDKRRSGKEGIKQTRRKLHLPSDPEQYADTVETFIERATPRKREILKRRNIYSPRARKKLKLMEKSLGVVKEILKENKTVKNTFIRKFSFLKKYRLSRHLSKYIDVRESVLCRVSKKDYERKRRSDATSQGVKRKIVEFYERNDVSTNLPIAKRIKKDGIERRVLDRPVTEVFEEFKKKNPEVKTSLSTFKRSKPRKVEITRKQPWYGCLCEACTNVELKLRSLSQLAAKVHCNIRVQNKYDAVSLTMCSKGDNHFHHLKCIKRGCTNCGSSGIVSHFEELANDSKDQIVTYTKWERVKRTYRGKEVTQVMPVTHKGTAT